MPDPATATAPELTIVRTFNAPPVLVFKAWTDPADLVRWLGPSGFHAHSITLDTRGGGAWRACIVSPDGNENLDGWALSRSSGHPTASSSPSPGSSQASSQSSPSPFAT